MNRNSSLNTKRALWSVCLWVLVQCSVFAQTNNEEGWFNSAEDTFEPIILEVPTGSTNDFGTNYLFSGISGTNIAEAITPDIEALARGLENDPQRIFDYVHEHISYVHYFGSKKGAQLTLLEGSGNEFDQCALLVALLRAAGHTNAGYQFGGQKVPYESTDHRDFQHWLGLWKPNTNWSQSYSLAYLVSFARGYPAVYSFGTNDTTNIAIHRLWVKLPLNGTNYLLDPAFRVSEPTTGVDLIAATGLSSNGLWTAAGGAVGANSVTNLTEPTLRNQLRDCTTNLLAYLRSNAPNASVEDVLGGWRVATTNSQPLTTQPTWPVINSANFPTFEWDNIPTNWMSKMTISFGNSNLTFFVPELQGRRLSMIFTNGQSQLWLDDEMVMQRANVLTSDNRVNVTMSIDHPHNDYSAQTATWFERTYHDQLRSGLYRTNGVYAIIYAFEASSAQLRKRQAKLDAYLQQGLADTSREVMSETLNVIGLNWLLQTEMMFRLTAAQSGSLSQNHHRFGRMSYEPSFGYYVDVYLQFSGIVSAQGISAQDRDLNQRAFESATYFESAMEHGVIEQLQSSNLVASSTIKLLQLANTNSVALYLVTSNNWSAVSGSLVNYNLSYLQGLVNDGHRMLLPQNGQIQIAGTGSWKGYGIVDKQVTTAGTGMGMLIEGGYQGGYSAFSYSVPSPSFISSWSYSAPTYFNPQPPSLPPIRAADPVNMVDGSFTVSENDLALGQIEPRGLNFSRDYSSRRRYHNLTGLGEGWTHNYFMNLAEVSAPQPGLGEATPAQMASMLVATRAALEFYAATNNAKNWAVTTLITKWGVDQLRSNAVSITLGNDAVQFIKQPDGQYTPPAGSKLTLLKTNSVFWLQEQHGRIFKFGFSGRLTNIVDQYNQSLSISYLATTSNLPQTVTDWKGRSLTFTYNGTPQRLASIADSTGRNVSYGFVTNGGKLDLTSVTDPESKTRTFLYDTNHQIVAVKDAANRLITTNIYDGFGRVVTQYSEGDLNKAWRLYWSGFVNVEQNPVGDKRRYHYDEKHRSVAIEDALGNVARLFYDGQDHTVMTVSPLNETNRSEYDGQHNLLRSIDPLGFTNRFYYDTQQRLTRSEDARGVTNWFGYNAQHSLTGSTNGAGDWATSICNTDGTVASRTDAGGTITNGYDSFGLLNSIIYPGGLGGETLVNHPRGDVTNHTNARGFTTTFQYNQRRQLTNRIAPTNLTARVVYDAAGNAQSTTDARGFTNSNIWSATQKLLATVLPGTPQGTPVMTNVYDSRDWLSRSINPLQQAALFTNDAAGRQISITDPLNRTVRFGYDADGRKVAATNAALEVTRQFWNARGESTKTVDGATNTALYAYDPAGNQVMLTNRNGKRWQFQFDAANRLTNSFTPLGRETRVTYDARGLVSTVREPSTQTTTNFYDAKGRLTNSADAIASRVLRYDANNNITNVVENGRTNTWTFDAYDQVQSYRDADYNLIQYRYDANGNLTNLIYPGNRVVAYAYDSLNRVTNVTDWANGQTSFEYDLASRLKKITRPNSTVRTLDYDSAGQMTNIWERSTTGSSNGTAIALFRLNWNSAARLDWEFAAPLFHSYTPPTRTMTFDDDNRLETFNGSSVTHDTDGNMTNGPLTNSTLVSYTFDARNRLLSVGGLNYGYDPAGNRTAVTNGIGVSRFVVNPNAALSQVLIRTKGSVTNFYIYGVGLLYEITETATSTNTLTYHFDFRGSTIALTDASGNITDRIEYSPYATTTYHSGTNDTPFLYNGRFGVQTDANGLLFMRARYFNSYLCRFINADPSGFSGGLNSYAFADGNPITMTDPFGLGAQALGLPSWISSSGNDIIRDGYMAAYQRTQAELAANYNSGYNGGGGSGSALSETLNMIPLVGTAKGFMELSTGKDWVTGQWHGRSDASLVIQVVLTSIIPTPARASFGSGVAAQSGAPLVNDLVGAATRARNTVGPGSGGAYGTRVHSAFEAEVQALGRGNVRTEVSYMNGVEVTRGTTGSVRLDVVEFGPNGQILNVYDLKTGSAALTPQRIQQIQSHIPGGATVPVLQVRP